MAKLNINQKIQLRGTVAAWAKITEKIGRNHMKKMGIRGSGSLKRSWSYQILGTPGSANFRIRFSHDISGAFVDMGVGKGVALGEQRAAAQISRLLGSKPRKPKPWYGKTIYGQTKRLADILATKTGDRAVDVFDELPKKITLRS